MKKFVLVCLGLLFTATISAASLGHSPTIKESVKSEMIKTDGLAMNVTSVAITQINFVELQSTDLSFVPINLEVISPVINPELELVINIRDVGKDQYIYKPFSNKNEVLPEINKKENKKLTDSWC